MISFLIFAVCAAGLICVGLYGMIARTSPLRRVLAFNVTGSGVFLLLGATDFRGVGIAPDPVPQAMIVTGIVVGIAATGFVLALIVRHSGLDQAAEKHEDVKD
jgi:multicomponent Na+:H+ antiporter subunit C